MRDRISSWRLPRRLGVERLADQKLDERPVRVIAAGLLAFLAAAWVDLSGFDLTQNLERLLCRRLPLGFLFLLINGLFSPLGFIGRNFFGLVVFEFVLDGIDKLERRSHGKIDLATDVPDGLALSVGEVQEAGIKLNLPKPLLCISGCQLQQTLIDRAELLNVQLAVRQPDFAHLPARCGNNGQRLQHFGNRSVAPREPIYQLRGAGIEQTATIGFDLSFRAKLGPLGEQSKQGTKRALEEGPIWVENGKPIRTSLSGKSHDLADAYPSR